MLPLSLTFLYLLQKITDVPIRFIHHMIQVGVIRPILMFGSNFVISPTATKRNRNLLTTTAVPSRCAKRTIVAQSITLLQDELVSDGIVIRLIEMN